MWTWLEGCGAVRYQDALINRIPCLVHAGESCEIDRTAEEPKAALSILKGCGRHSVGNAKGVTEVNPDPVPHTARKWPPHAYLTDLSRNQQVPKHCSNSEIKVRHIVRKITP